MTRRSKSLGPGLVMVSILVGALSSLSPAAVDGTGSTAEAIAWYQQGKDALAANRYMESSHQLNRAFEAGVDDVELLYWLGVAYWNREMADSAITAYRRAIEQDPDGQSMWTLYALENVAEVYTRSDRMTESAEAYRQALARETRPEWILKIRNQLAELDLATGTYTPDESTVYNDRGEVIGGVGPGDMHTNRPFEIARHTTDPVKEEHYYRLAIETDPSMFQSYFNLGLALVRQGRYGEAVEWLARSDTVWQTDTEYNPGQSDKVDANAFLALSYLELGDLQLARVHADIAMAAGSNNFWARLYSLRVRVARGEAAEALAQLEALLIDHPEHAEVWHAISEARTALGQPDEAHEALMAAVRYIPGDHPWMTRLRIDWNHPIQ